MEDRRRSPSWLFSRSPSRPTLPPAAQYRETNSRIDSEMLGDHRPALTTITDIYTEEWLLDMEAVAVA